jgi:hypothetical protein
LRHRFAWINDFPVGGVVEITAAEVVTIQADRSPFRLTSKYDNADSQSQRFCLRVTYLVKQTRERACVSAGDVGLDAKVDAIVGSKYGAARQENTKDRQNRGDWTSGVACHASLTSAANNFASSATRKEVRQIREFRIQHAKPLVRNKTPDGFDSCAGLQNNV